MVRTKFVRHPPAIIIRPRPTLCTPPLTDWEGYVGDHPQSTKRQRKVDKVEEETKEESRGSLKCQFPSHLCFASRDIKIEEAQIPLFQVSLQFPDESSVEREFQLQGLF